MSHEALLAFQRAVVTELTGPAWLVTTPATMPPPLDGIDAERVALLARLTQGKRLDKIAKRMPATFRALGPELRVLVPLFAARHPMFSASGYRNALQFYRFLLRQSRSGRITPEWIIDLAACELAVAVVAQREDAEDCPPVDWSRATVVSVRRSRHALFLLSGHDVRSLLSGGGEGQAVERRTVPLAVVPEHGPGTTRILELEPSVFSWVRSLRSWQMLAADDVARDDIRELLGTLTSAGLVRLRVEPAVAGCVQEQAGEPARPATFSPTRLTMSP